jgi:superfamily II DNA or RNA helicase
MSTKPMISLRPHQLRGVDAMSKHNKGQLIKPTGAGKTLTMIADALKEFAKETPQTIVVVAPRILLSEQLSSEFLEFIVDAAVLHVHSGETTHFNTTKPLDIRNWVDTHNSSSQTHLYNL